MVPLAVLDLSPITEGSDAGQALRNSLDLARHVEALGYRRFWMAERLDMACQIERIAQRLPGIAAFGDRGEIENGEPDHQMTIAYRGSGQRASRAR